MITSTNLLGVAVTGVARCQVQRVTDCINHQAIPSHGDRGTDFTAERRRRVSVDREHL
jgi:hypothetical protein